MVQVTNFLLRWLFLCRLVDDRAEVQTWPYRRPGYYEHGQHPSHQPQIEHNIHINNEGHPSQHYDEQHQSQQPPQLNANNNFQDSTSTTSMTMDIPTYRESVIRTLTSYPPGSSERLHRLEELRLQTVHEFARQLVEADEIIRYGKLLLPEQKKNVNSMNVVDDDDSTRRSEGTKQPSSSNVYDSSSSHHADTTIQDEMQQFMQQQQHHSIHHQSSQDDEKSHSWRHFFNKDGDSTAQHNIDSAESSSSTTAYNPLQNQTPEQRIKSLSYAHKLLKETREMLPQLVSTVLHSPPALLPETSIIDPISSLRSLLIHRCQTNPSLGIELCWLLEAEVGRKWKALFEHRQQTGKRLILIVQSDIAAAIATIGAEKASAFNLLQDAEMATAFGVERTMETHYHQMHNNDNGYYYGNQNQYNGNMLYGDNSYHHQQQYQYHHQNAGGFYNHHHHHPSISQQQPRTASSRAAAAPPQSISDLRCRHYGDSMHFIDRLTQISLDLRHVPPSHRQSVLQSRLHELNMRLCRRMISRGQISIDVDENEFGLYDNQQYQHYQHHHVPPQHTQSSSWKEENVREDMIQHSVHFPMEPQCVTWPGGLKAGSSYSSTSSSSSNTASSSDQKGTSTGDDNSNNFATTISDFEHPAPNNGVVRALRILPMNCRVLDSAQRCPFLVRMEVVETGLDGNDARLYASAGDDGVGVTIQEALGSVLEREYNNGGFDPCEIPPELMSEEKPGRNDDDATTSSSSSSRRENDCELLQQSISASLDSPASLKRVEVSGLESYKNIEKSEKGNNKAVIHSRGGGYQDGDGYYPPDAYGMVPDAFEMVREQYYEDLHHDLRQERENEYNSPTHPSILHHHQQQTGNQLSMGSILLDNVFGRSWNVECENIRQQSPYRNVKGWKLASFIIKAGEDIRKEALVMQIMSKLWTWFQEEIPPHLRPFLRPYTIMCVGGDAGIVECLPDVKSVSEVKKETDGFTSLRNFFERAYGPPVNPPYRPDYQQQQQQPPFVGTVSFEKARDNFLRSLVGYSVVCYILQIKDRHNANVLMDREGHIMVSILFSCMLHCLVCFTALFFLMHIFL